ncbi:MAG TPA: D-alanyl-D-alanine carboxypeptidase/D-alanyl-D-alanine-endopeptidase [Candidatus Acidoferrum sp.]|nr:D-alanyl-D-alanine carboxypeptidase/D-alanyl-D-alanine-endopeptidase [Candidatus Acidoferrum sp.]
MSPNKETLRATEVAGHGWIWRCALLLLLAMLREEASTDFRLYFQSMGIAKSGIARSSVYGLFGLALATFAGAQETGSQEKVNLAAARFAGRVESLLGAAPVDKGEWGLLVVDAESGATLYEKNANDYFLPASNMKLLTTALALDTLGPEYKFRTTVETNGTLARNGRLSGDLILVGRGDPNLSNRKFPFENKEEFDGPPEKVLAELADAIAARGVKRITGDVVGDDSYFPRERYPDGWEIDDMVWEYGAAISAIVVDDNTVKLTLTPAEKAGGRVAAVVEPATREFIVKNEVTTIGAKEKPDLRLTREPGGDTVAVTGVMPAGSSPRKLVLAIQEPALHAANLLAQLLRDRGIKIGGKVRAVHEPDPGEAKRKVLAEHLSIPLKDSVKLVNKISQNLHTEVLLRVAARQQGRWATPEDLQKFPEAFYAKAGIPLGDVVQTDGSGLSRHDLVTPRAFVALLAYAKKQPWFPEFLDSLPIAGADGTLNERMKDPPLAGKIHAKTGSVTHVRALSGYAETPGGRKLIFSLLSNNQGAKGHEVHSAMDGICLAMVEEFDEKSEVMKQ